MILLSELLFEDCGAASSFTYMFSRPLVSIVHLFLVIPHLKVRNLVFGDK